MRIAHIAAECSPFAKTGGLGDVVGSLPVAQARLGHHVSVWLPLYRKVWESLDRMRVTPELAIDPFKIDLGFRTHEVGVLKTTIPGSDVPIYFIGSDPHFDRPEIYDRDYFGFDDGVVRYSVFVRAAMEAMKRLWMPPDVLHAHDWHTALAPMALAWDEPKDWVFSNTVSVLTIHNLAYQGIYPLETFIHLGLPIRALGGVEWGGAINLMKGAIAAADVITAVSPNFAREMMTKEGGFGLDPLLRYRWQSLLGIVNGIDPHVWNPRVDPKIPRNYDLTNLSAKRDNRKELLQLAGMDPNDSSFVVGAIGRLTNQKGYDMLFPVLEDLLNRGVRVVMLGSGDARLEGTIHHLSHNRQGRFWGYVGFDDNLAHLIEAGTDSFLMPSRFEPCGLNQLYSLAYATPPIVRRVGGLADTVVGYNGWNRGDATGFTFDLASPSALRDSVLWAQNCYHDPDLWTRLIRNGMTQDWSWQHSAEMYLDVYEKTRRFRGRA
jgi:starch synthase